MLPAPALCSAASTSRSFRAATSCWAVCSAPALTVSWEVAAAREASSRCLAISWRRSHMSRVCVGGWRGVRKEAQNAGASANHTMHRTRASDPVVTIAHYEIGCWEYFTCRHTTRKTYPPEKVHSSCIFSEEWPPHLRQSSNDPLQGGYGGDVFEGQGQWVVHSVVLHAVRQNEVPGAHVGRYRVGRGQGVVGLSGMSFGGALSRPCALQTPPCGACALYRVSPHAERPREKQESPSSLSLCSLVSFSFYGQHDVPLPPSFP